VDNKNDVLEQILRLSRVTKRKPARENRISHGAYRITNAVMENDGIRTTDLAKIFDVRPASLSDSLKKLEKRGYIRREQDEIDLRTVRLYATDKVRAEHSNWILERKHYKECLARSITEEEAEIFCRICDKLCDFFEKEYSKDSRKEETDRNIP
jgi:DNA-binding MarR family transcriptional regulator